jgi:hypothetical protein
MSTIAPALDTPTLVITEEILVKASIEQTFASLLVQLGPQNDNGDGKPMPMVLEAKPGGRWYRDLGGDAGHLWGFVQSIKTPALLEIWGPLFMSSGATSNMIYRLSETDGGTRISFKHTVVGPVPDQVREHMHQGWAAMHARVKLGAESK